MTYKSIVISDAHKTKQLAKAVEEKSNEMALLGYELVTMAVTAAQKAVLVFKTDAPVDVCTECAEEDCQDENLGDNAVCDCEKDDESSNSDVQEKAE